MQDLVQAKLRHVKHSQGLSTDLASFAFEISARVKTRKSMQSVCLQPSVYLMTPRR